jgi:hypothetical protein
MKYKPTNFLIYFVWLFLTSCTFQNAQNEKSDDSQKKSIFMSDEEIENIIQKHHPLFLSYWVGMNRSEFHEVTRYLLDKEIISGLVYDPQDDSSTYYCSDYSLDFNNKCGYREFNKNNVHLLLQDNSRKLLVLIDHTLFELNFNFSHLDGEYTLSNIKLSAESKITTSSVIEYERCKPIFSIYKEKYGVPFYEHLDPPNSGNCYFINGNTRINIDFLSGKSYQTKVPENCTAVSYITIEYLDIERSNRILNQQKNKEEMIKKNNDYERQKLEEQIHSETFDKI